MDRASVSRRSAGAEEAPLTFRQDVPKSRSRGVSTRRLQGDILRRVEVSGGGPGGGAASAWPDGSEGAVILCPAIRRSGGVYR